MVLHVADDLVITAAVVIGIAWILARWGKSSRQELASTNRVLVILSAIVLLAVLFALTQEFNDPADFANDPGQLIVGLALIINRFV